jgi:hypothetical protein
VQQFVLLAVAESGALSGSSEQSAPARQAGGRARARPDEGDELSDASAPCRSPGRLDLGVIEMVSPARQLTIRSKPLRGAVGLPVTQHEHEIDSHLSRHRVSRLEQRLHHARLASALAAGAGAEQRQRDERPFTIVQRCETGFMEQPPDGVDRFCKPRRWLVAELAGVHDDEAPVGGVFVEHDRSL